MNLCDCEDPTCEANEVYASWSKQYRVPATAVKMAFDAAGHLMGQGVSFDINMFIPTFLAGYRKALDIVGMH